MKEWVAEKSTKQGFPRSRLPELSEAEIKYLKGTSDFFGLNHYNTFLVYYNESVNGKYAIPSYQDDYNSVVYMPPSWTINPNEFIQVHLAFSLNTYNDDGDIRKDDNNYETQD